MKWISPNTVTGAPAEGDKYYVRKDVEGRIMAEIVKGNHILFQAPRRVGKSSVVKSMAKNHREDLIMVYQNIQSDASLNEFYKRLISLIRTGLKMYDKFALALGEIFGKYQIKSIGTEGIELDDKERKYRDVFFNMLDDLQKRDIRIVLFLDEFPDVVKNIAKYEGEQSAEMILNDIREVRHTDKFKDTFTLVLLGSVGLKHIVSQITGRVDKINDLHLIDLDALSTEEALSLINQLVKDATMTISEEVQVYMLDKLGHCFPYFIQLMIEECDDQLKRKDRATLEVEDVDQAYLSLLKKNDKFSDWNQRLKEYFPKRYGFINLILVRCAHQNQITIQELYDIAVKEGLQHEYMEILEDILVADGYLYKNETIYYFNSPLLRDWWKIRNPIIL